MFARKKRIAFRMFLFHLNWSQTFKPAPAKMSRLRNTGCGGFGAWDGGGYTIGWVNLYQKFEIEKYTVFW